MPTVGFTVLHRFGWGFGWFLYFAPGVLTFHVDLFKRQYAVGVRWK